MDGRSALLTLWGERVEQLSMVLGATYTIMAVKAANEFKGQRAYNSTPSTFLGHLSHSGDLLLWVGVRRRPSSVVRRALTSSPQKLLGQS